MILLEVGEPVKVLEVGEPAHTLEVGECSHVQQVGGGPASLSQVTATPVYWHLSAVFSQQRVQTTGVIPL